MKLEYKRGLIKNGSKTIANIRRDRLCAGTGTTTLCNVRDDRVRKGTGSTTLCNVKNGDIRDGTGSSRKAQHTLHRYRVDNIGIIVFFFLQYQ